MLKRYANSGYIARVRARSYNMPSRQVRNTDLGRKPVALLEFR